MRRQALGLQIAAAAASALSLAAATAEAQTTHIPSSNWRQKDRASALEETERTTQNFTFELRLGPYYPEVDEGASVQGKTPYKDTFGEGAQFYFGLEVDYLPLRIPYVGAIGPGFGWGYTTISAKTKIIPAEGAEVEAEADADADADEAETSAETTRLSIMPMHLSLVLRADELMRRTGVPIVPYVKLGYGLAWWRVSDDSGTSVRKDEITREKLEGDENLGLGTTPGIHFALGGMLCLDFLNPQSAARLDESTSINHAYFFGEWMNARYTGFGSSERMRVATSTWVLGLAFDL